MKRNSKIFLDTIKKNRLSLILFIVLSLLNLAVFFLYSIPLEPFIYAEILLFVVIILFFFLDYLHEKTYAKQREISINNILLNGGEDIYPNTLRDEDYLTMIASLSSEIEKLKTDYSIKRQNDDDYYTMWIHQIKTPIAVMKLELSKNGNENLVLTSELFRIEQYVEMVLSYIRLDSSSNDLLIKEYSLDEIVKETIRKFATQFILKKLKLNYVDTNYTIVTDKKWFGFILEQLIANAIKYTPEGEISIIVSEDKIEIKDTGIGIAKEDLPRIFEKGYTGVNGRLGEKSSGLGLFLTKKAADLLSIKLDVTSVTNEGSIFTVYLPKN